MDPIYVTPCSCPHSSRSGTTKSWYLWALCPMSQRAGESRGEIGRMRSVVIDWTLSSTPDCSLVAPDLAKLVNWRLPRRSRFLVQYSVGTSVWLSSLKRPVLESIFWVDRSSTERRSCLAMRSNTLIVILHHSRHWSPWTEMARRCLIAFDSRQTNGSCELWLCEARSAISATKRAYRVVPDGRGR